MSTVNYDAYNGAIILFNCGPTSRQLCAEKLAQLREGFDKLVPNERTPEACLKSALLQFCDEHKTKLRDLQVQSHKNPKVNGYEIVVIERDESHNDYYKSFSVKHDASDGLLSFDFSVQRSDADTIRALFEEHKGMLTAAGVGTMLVSVLGKLGAVTMREQGGIYWLPIANLPVWRELAKLLEGTPNKLFDMVTGIDAGTVRAVSHFIHEEVEKAVAVLTDDVTRNLQTEEAIERRLVVAHSLHDRVKLYENLLGETMQDLHQAVNSCEQAAGAAAAIKAGREVFDGMFAEK